MAVYLIEEVSIKYKDDDRQGHGIRTLSAETIKDLRNKVDSHCIFKDEVTEYLGCTEKEIFG